MADSKWLTEKQFRLFSILLFAALFVYLILRALFVDYLHDEAATFFHYIESGYFFGPKSITDANNHILNSLVGHGLFRLFGENHFLFRLPNLLCFPVYFWAVYQLISTFKNTVVRLLILLGLTCIPFILEYFGYTRGYGISLAFFLASLVFLQRLMTHISLRTHLIIVVCLIIASYANLTYLVSAVLASVFILIQQFRQKDFLTQRQQILHFGLHFLLAISLVPAGIYARVLKNGGALYYGRLDGLWDVTGTTLSRYTLFTDHIVLKWVFLLLGFVIIFMLVRRWWKIRFHSFFGDDSTLFAWFLFGHLFVIVTLAFFMEVNYPEDRVGMYLIPLSILLLASELYRFKKLHFLFLGLLFFPISFIPRINLSTSIFSPDDRMTKDFYQKVEKTIKSDYTSVSIYHMMQLTWAMHNRHTNKIHFPAISNEPNNASDLFLSRKNLHIPTAKLAQFDTLCVDPSNGFLAFKRKIPWKKTIISNTIIPNQKSTEKVVRLISITIPDSLKNKPLQLHIKGDLWVDVPQNEVAIQMITYNKNNKFSSIQNVVTKWSNGLKKRQEILINYPIEKWTKDDNEVRIYLFNRLQTEVELKNIKFEILKLE